MDHILRFSWERELDKEPARITSVYSVCLYAGTGNLRALSLNWAVTTTTTKNNCGCNWSLSQWCGWATNEKERDWERLEWFVSTRSGSCSLLNTEGPTDGISPTTQFPTGTSDWTSVETRITLPRFISYSQVVMPQVWLAQLTKILARDQSIRGFELQLLMH